MSRPESESANHVPAAEHGVHHGSTASNSCNVARNLLVEQVMRMTDDDRILLPFLDAPAASVEILAATGRLLASPPTPFPLGTPLSVWVAAEAADAVGNSHGEDITGWRSRLPVRERTLWDDLEFLRLIVGALHTERPTQFCCPYEELEHLRLTTSSGMTRHEGN